jgi:AbrB family looped-hinge helix DNA binding protein
MYKSLPIIVETANVSENGRVVIPVAFRRMLGLNGGGPVMFVAQGEEVRITTKKQALERARRRIRRYVKPGISLADELIVERREAAKRE